MSYTFESGSSLTLTVSITSGATVIVTDGTTTLTGTSVNDECVFTIPNTGTWNVTASKPGETASGTIVIDGAYGLYLTFIDPILSNNTPDKIQQAAQEGIAANFWSVGDKTALIAFNGTVGSLNMNGMSACAFIIGFDHNTSKEDTGIHFQFGKLSNGKDVGFVDSSYGTNPTSGTWFNLNMTATNSGGWKSSRMRTTICPSFKNALPSEWQSVISACTKYTDNTGASSNTASAVTSTSDDIFLLSEFEVMGASSNANQYEKNSQMQYAYYAAGNSKVKYKYNATSTECNWWTRSAYRYSSDKFIALSQSTSNSVAANGDRGFAPGFKIA